MDSSNPARAVFYALFANLGIAVAKGIAAFYTRSGSMMAETIHSLADCANQLLLLVGMSRAKKPPTADHPLGYGMSTSFFSFIVAMLLFSMGGLFSIYEGIHKIHAAEPVQKAWIGILVLSASIVLEGLSLLGALGEIKKLRGTTPFFTWLKTTRNSELIVVLGEDVAATLGLLTALIFLVLSDLLHSPALDGAGSVAIGVLLILVSLFLMVRMHALLIGKSADPALEETLRTMARRHTGVEEVFRIITLQNGPYVVLAGKVKLSPGMEIDAACRIINALEKEIKESVPEVRWIFMEPDIAD